MQYSLVRKAVVTDIHSGHKELGKQARIADASVGPEAETLTRDEALSRRLRVINNPVVLCELEEPSLREKKRKWSKFEGVEAGGRKNSSPQLDPFEFPIRP
jgi:hypothetical protein